MALVALVVAITAVAVPAVVAGGPSGRAASKAQVVCCLRADYGKLMTTNNSNNNDTGKH